MIPYPATPSSSSTGLPLPPHSSITILNEPDAPASDPSNVLIVELPAAGFRMIRRVLFCFGIVVLLSCIPIIGVWFFFIYPKMMPGPAANVPVAETSTNASVAPSWYAGMVLLSIAFISAIFVFAAFIYLLEAAHILYGRTRYGISGAGIDLQRLLFGRHLRFGERFLEAEDIHGLQLLPDRGRRYGSIRLTVEHHRPIDLAEEVPTADRHWLAEILQQNLKIN